MTILQLPPYPIFPELIGDNILLRAISTDDIKDIIEISFYDGKAAINEQEAAAMQHKIDADYLRGDSIHWGIADKYTDTIMGTCGYYRGLDKGIGELGCILKPAFRGQGHMSAALKLAIDFGLHTIKLSRITAITSQENRQALKLLTRLHFIKTADLADDSVEFEFLQK